MGLCPFHAEKTPSFSVSPDKQIFYCFGCHTGGNVFSFLMQQDGLTFPEAVRAVAAKYAIEVPDERLSPERKRQLSEKEKLYKLNEAASGYFQRMLNDPSDGQKAMGYLLARGMTKKIMETHGLGYAPKRWDGILGYFGQYNVSPRLLLKTGLIIPRKDGSGYYDRFRDRVMFPIFNQNHQVIGFGGRVMGDETPKYLNSPETVLYSKRRSLYGIDKAKTAARKEGCIFLVEGYFDVLALHLYGMENAVATLGTALTQQHVQLLKGMVGPNGQVILVYDSDQAGVSAARRSISVFEEGYLDARILVLPQGEDPDTYLRENGPEAFHKASETALGMMPFLIESLIRDYGLTLQGKVKIVNALQQPLAAVQDTVARSLYIRQVSERLDLEESAVMEKVRQASSATRRSREGDQKAGFGNSLSDARRMEQQIVAMMLRNPATIPDVVSRNLMAFFEDKKLQTIAEMIAARNSGTDGHESIVAEIISLIEDQAYRNLMTRLAMADTHWDRNGCDRLLNQFEMRVRRQDTKDLQLRIEEAEKNHDFDLLSKLLRQKQQIAGTGMIHS